MGGKKTREQAVLDVQGRMMMVMNVGDGVGAKWLDSMHAWR